MKNRTFSLVVLAMMAVMPKANVVAQAPIRIFAENFDTLTLKPNLDEGFADPTAFTHTAPAGWTVNNADLNANIPAIDPITGAPLGVREWRGWSFVDPSFWVGADNQGRDRFTRGAGVVAVADPDEFDDLSDPLSDEGAQSGVFYKTKLSTPSIDIASIPANQNIYVTFDSSWLGETNDEVGENQTSTVSVGGVERLRWEASPFVLNPDLSRSETPNPFYRAGAVTGDAENPVTGENYNERIVITVPRSQIAGNSFAIDFGMDKALNDWWWAIDNIQVFAGTQVPSTEFGLKAVVNRDTGEMTLVNNSDQVTTIRGYTVASLDGSLIPADYSPLADSQPGWVQLSTATSKTDISEGLVSGTYSVAPGATISLGEVWLQNPDENGDLSFKYLDAGGVLVNSPVEFVGNGGSAFPFGDLDFDGDVDVADWTEFKSDIPSVLAGLSTPELYRQSDLTGDGVHNLRDIIRFRQAYDSFNGAGAFAQIGAVPEPSTLVSLGALAVVTGMMRHRKESARG